LKKRRKEGVILTGPCPWALYAERKKKKEKKVSAVLFASCSIEVREAI
jgi:hypothetical protein